MRYVGAELQALLGFDALVCLDPDCRAGGMIAHHRGSVDERFPGPLSSRFTPIPDALMDHAAALGLGTNEMVIVWALERHRRAIGDEVWPSQQRLSELTRLSVPTVKRSITKLVKLGLLTLRRSYFKDTGRRAPNRYTLDGCWQKLADRETASSTMGHSEPWSRDHSEPWRETASSEVTRDQGEPPSTDQNGDTPGITVSQEVDVQRKRCTAEVDPAGTSPAPRTEPDALDESAPDVADTGDLDSDSEEYAIFNAWWERHPRLKSFSAAYRRYQAETAAAEMSP